MKNSIACSGCQSDLCNGNNDLGIRQCWLLKGAKIIRRYRIPSNAPSNVSGNYVSVRVPNCYHQCGYVYVDKIPVKRGE